LTIFAVMATVPLSGGGATGAELTLDGTEVVVAGTLLVVVVVDGGIETCDPGTVCVDGSAGGMVPARRSRFASA
jgi:hypothetical protein